MDPKPRLGNSPEENAEYYHNKGQEDAAKGVYNSPSHGWLNSSDDARNSDLYDQGHRHTDSQTKD